jgi:hypothetical protein
MRQKPLNNIGGLLRQSQDAVSGAAQLGAGLLTTNTEANITADRGALVTAVDAYETGRRTLASKRAVARSVTLTARTLAKTVRDVLENTLGTRYSQAWDVVGFKGSLAIPGSTGEVLLLLERLQTFLNTEGAPNIPELDVTPERATGLVNELRIAKAAVNTQRGEVTQLFQTRKSAEVVLRKRMRGLIEELRQKLGALDGRWKTFGLNMPGAKEIPAVPTNVLAILIGETAASVKWTASARADYYRVWKKVIGVDEEFVAAGSPADLDFTMEELPRNSTIEIAVSAVNNGGESGRSQSVQIVTH